jgi:hypothetical protein
MQRPLRRWLTHPESRAVRAIKGEVGTAMYPMMQERRSRPVRLVWWAFWVLVAIYVFHHPAEAAVNARALGAWLTSASESIVTFVQQSTAGSR